MSDWYGTGSRVKVLTREFERNHPEEADCPECGHPVSGHGPKYGCEVERGDQHESGFAPMAAGPCGCTAVTVQCVHGPDTHVHVNLFTGEIRCLICDEVLNIEELFEDLAFERGKPYDLDVIL